MLCVFFCFLFFLFVFVFFVASCFCCCFLFLTMLLFGDLRVPASERDSRSEPLLRPSRGHLVSSLLCAIIALGLLRYMKGHILVSTSIH